MQHKRMTELPYLVAFYTYTGLLVLQCLDAVIDRCPVDVRGPCHCYYEDIICNNSRVVPRFIQDNHVYRAIDLSGQGIYEVRSAAFYYLKVRRIDMNFNPIGNELNADAFAAVDRVLRRLSIGGCNLPYLKPGLLMNMHNLRVLHLWDNRIDALPSGYFQHSTPQLEELQLWGNNISRLHDNTFLGLSRLRRLDLDKNEISQLNGDVFRHTPRLETLHLGENKIQTLYSNTFRHLPNLKLLNLDQNGLKYLLADAFAGLRNLISLGLQNNKIDFLMDYSFRDLRNVQLLHLHSNEMNLLWSKTFAGLERVQQLHLSDNKITNLQRDVFTSCRRLLKLQLDNNAIHTIDPCIVSHRTRLRKLSLYSNPLKCGCKLRWLQELSDRGAEVHGSCKVNSTARLRVTSPKVYKRRGADQCPYISSYCNQL